MTEKTEEQLMTNHRPATLTAAAAVCVVNSLGNLAAFGAPPIPRPVAYASLVLALAGLVGAFGIWRLTRWGALASVAVLALTALLAAPGIAFASVPALRAVAIVTVIVDIAGVALLLVPASRRVYNVRSVPAR
jgi:hypothetical protein